MSIFRPAWFHGLSLYSEQDRMIRNRYLVKSAALIHTPEGTLQLLAHDLGIHYHSLVRLYLSGRPISPQMAVQLEQTVGKEALPRKLLRPDVFE